MDGGTLLPPNAPADLHSAMASLAAAGCGGSADTNALMDTSHVQQLINHGADVNASDNNGWTPLHTAAYHGQEEIVRILLAANSDVNARNKSEETPLHLAAKWPQDRVVEALLAGGADLSARNKRGRTPAHVAALFNRHAILDRLLNAGETVHLHIVSSSFRSTRGGFIGSALAWSVPPRTAKPAVAAGRLHFGTGACGPCATCALGAGCIPRHPLAARVAMGKLLGRSSVAWAHPARRVRPTLAANQSSYCISYSVLRVP